MSDAIDEEFWSNRFHFCALAAGFLAAKEGRLDDSRYVQRLAYDLYERGEFVGASVSRELTDSLSRATRCKKRSEEDPHAPQEESHPRP
jgi:hypothetical protein